MKIKRIISLMMVMLIAVTSMAGCGVNKENEDGEQVVLRWVMPGPGRQKDSEEVWAKVNEKIQEKLPNVTVEFEVIPTADYAKKVLLMQTGREKMDIVNTYLLTYESEVANGSFIEIQDLLDEYGKGIKEQLPEWLFDYARIDGGLYSIPSYQALAELRGFATRKDYAEKWLDIEGLKKELYSSDYVTDGAMQIVEDYLKNLSDNGKIHYGAHHYIDLALKGYETISGNFIADVKTHKVEYKFELPSYKDYYRRTSEWYQKGWIRKDALSATDENEKRYLAEGFVLWESPYNKWIEADISRRTGVDYIIIPYGEKHFIPMTTGAGGTAITTSCKYPEEAMQVINLMQSDKEIYNLFTYGIEGKHYTKINENKIETPYGEQPTSTADYGIQRWLVGNTQLAYLTQNEPDDKLEYEFGELNASDYRSELIGFVPDFEEVTDEVAQINALKGEYMKTLATGALGAGWEDYYNEWMNKLNAAGLQKVKEVLQKQVDEFLANKN